VRRFVLALAVTLGLLVLTPSPSWACSCAMATTKQQVKNAVTVAAGTVDWTATDNQTRTYEVDFDAVWKGTAASSEKLVTAAADSACGVGDLAPGKRYLFFIEGRHPGVMRIGLCGGTAAYDATLAGQVQAITGPPGRPLAAPDRASGDEPSRSGHTTSRVVLAAAGTTLLVIAVAAVVVRRRGRQGGRP
jgi:hypothetical protein